MNRDVICGLLKKLLSFGLLSTIIFSFCGCSENIINNNQEFTPTGKGEYIHHLFNNCTYSKTSSNQGCIEDNGFEVANDYIFKYAHDSNRYVAYHKMKLSSDTSAEQTVLYKRKVNSIIYDVLSDEFCIYDSSNGSILCLSTADELIEYINENKILLSNWYYPSSGQSIEGTQTQLSTNYVFEDVGKYKGQSILKDGVPIFSGYIKIVENSDEKIVFNLKIAESDYDIELIDNCNLNLSSLSHDALGSYFVNFWLKFPVYYDKFLVLDAQSGALYEFENKNEALKFIKTKG